MSAVLLHYLILEDLVISGKEPMLALLLEDVGRMMAIGLNELTALASHVGVAYDRGLLWNSLDILVVLHIHRQLLIRQVDIV